MRKTLFLSIFSSMLILVLGGCQCLKCPPKKVPPAVKAPAPAPAPVAKPAPAPQGKCQPCMSSNIYSTSGAVKLTKSMPLEVQANKPFDYYIEVTNITEMTLSNVVVTENLANGFKFVSASPAAQADTGKLVWVMDTLAPNSTQKIKVTGAAADSGCLKTCAKVTYDILTCANTSVVQPSLKLTKEAPAEVLICDNIPLKFTVTNSGTGVTSNVVIKDTLPEGLVAANGQTVLTSQVGNLDPGQTKAFVANVKAKKTGTYTNRATATADGDLKADSLETKTIVRQPVLAITKTMPESRFIGRDIECEITVSNKGDAPASSTVIRDPVPAGTTFISATDNGTLNAGSVVWNIGTIAPAAVKKVTVIYRANAAGEISNKATASAVCADDVSASAKTKVGGIPAVLLEVVDISDPIEVGRNETYEITVTNQGSASDTNIRIKCVLEDEMQYVSSGGPTAGALEGDAVTFQPLPSLSPKAQATWKVTVKALKPGDVRFKVILQTEQLKRTVEETESTNFYQ